MYEEHNVPKLQRNLDLVQKAVGTCRTEPGSQ